MLLAFSCKASRKNRLSDSNGEILYAKPYLVYEEALVDSPKKRSFFERSTSAYGTKHNFVPPKIYPILGGSLYNILSVLA
jgi:hypothetical protein